ncbi:MAG: AMP-binding protein, partial [Kiloniellales bacterium]|nr:AMP-binding protein [Kiloniellales bacterium]
YLFRTVGGGTRPIINYTGGTEVSGGLLTNVLVKPIAPCVFNAAAPGVALSIRAEDGTVLAADSAEPGELAIDNVFPGMTRGLWQDPQTYVETYWTRFPGAWSHGDLVQCRGGYWDLRGRADDVMKIAGRRIGPAEVEAAVSDISGLAAVAAVGLPDPRQGEALHVFVVPAATASQPALPETVAGRLTERLGKAFRPAGVHCVPDLPRTRNNKVMRRVVRRVAMGEPPGDLSALDNPACIDDLPRLRSD